MPKQDRKSKMISLRLTADEYDSLHALYSSYGARNVSDLARLALQHITRNSPSSESALLSKVQNIDERLGTVEIHLSRLLARQKITG